MASLKELRARIGSIKSTRKITSAMKMVAAAKLRRAQASAEAARPYAAAMRRMLGELAAATKGEDGAPRLLAGTGQDKVHLLVPLTSDRGLCGGFNSNVHRLTVQTIRRLQSEGKTVKLLPVGRRAFNFFRVITLILSLIRLSELAVRKFLFLLPAIWVKKSTPCWKRERLMSAHLCSTSLKMR